MNYKVLMGIIGVAAIVCGVTYYYAKKSERKRKTEASSERSQNQHDDPSIKNEMVEVMESKSEDILDQKKADVAEKIMERHEEAKNIIRESMDNIFGESEKRETKNEDVKKKIIHDLDAL